MFQTIIYQPQGRRKPEEFVIYKPQDGTVLIQSDKSIARIDLQTKQMTANFKGSNAKYGVHLTVGLPGVIETSCPDDLFNEIISKMPKAGDLIVPGMYWS
jgi:hypothetical protein